METLVLLADIGVGIMTALAIAALAWGAWLSLVETPRESHDTRPDAG